MSNIHVSINSQLLDYIEQLQASGAYSTKSEVINQALRVLQERDTVYQMRLAKLREEVQLGEVEAKNGGFSTKSPEEIFQEAMAIHKINKLNKNETKFHAESETRPT